MFGLSNFLLRDMVITISPIVLLAYSFFGIDSHDNFPGGLALIPVLGATLIIFAGPNAWFNRVVLSSRILVWFGLISFPLYLWHWPLLTFSRILGAGIPDMWIRVSAILFSIILSWITYRFVEIPIRFSKTAKLKTVIAFLTLTLFFIGFLGYKSYESNGFVLRPIQLKFSSYIESLKVTNRAKECFEIPHAYDKPTDWFCILGNGHMPTNFFAYGDSHALSFLPALEKFSYENNINMKFAGASGCPSLLGIQSMRGELQIEMYNCRALNERVFDYVKATGIKNVILINRWTYYTHSFSRPDEFNPIAKNETLPVDKKSSTIDLFWAINNTVQRYSEIGVNVIFVEDNPQQRFEPKDVLRKGQGLDSEYLKLSVSFNEHKKNQKIVNEIIQNTRAKIINLDDALCLESICPLVENKRFIYSDDDHLSIDGAFYVFSTFSKQLKKIASI